MTLRGGDEIAASCLSDAGKTLQNCKLTISVF
jgi:hypothetical protein